MELGSNAVLVLIRFTQVMSDIVGRRENQWVYIHCTCKLACLSCDGCTGTWCLCQLAHSVGEWSLPEFNVGKGK